MATAIAYTRVTISRFGFSVLDITVNRNNTPESRDMICKLIIDHTSKDMDDMAFVKDEYEWAGLETGVNNEGVRTFNMASDSGDFRDDYHVSINLYLVHDKS